MSDLEYKKQISQKTYSVNYDELVKELLDQIYYRGVQAPFNRLRVAQAQKLFDNQLQYNGQPVFWDEKITDLGGASIIHDRWGSSVDLTVSNDGEEIIRQLKEYQRYQSGNGQAIKMTYAPDVNSDEIELVLRTTSGAFQDIIDGAPGPGTVFDYVIPRDEWNYDKLDGNGPSGITLNLDCAQIFTPDLEWLSVGTIRFGFDIGGIFIATHMLHNANILKRAYMTTANLPCRHTIRREDTTIIQEIGYNDHYNGIFIRYKANGQTSGTLKQICTAIESEGGLEEEAGFPFSAGAGSSTITLAPGASFTAIAQHQLTFNGIENRAKYIPQLAVVSTTDTPVLVEYIYNPTVVGGTFVPVTGDVYDSIMERNVTGAVTGGNVIFQETILASAGQGNQKSTSGSAKTTLVSKLPFGIGIDGDTPIPFAVMVTNLDGVNTDIFYSFIWKEIR